MPLSTKLIKTKVLFKIFFAIRKHHHGILTSGFKLIFHFEVFLFVLAIFSFHHRVELALIVWSLLLILLSRAVNIFPLSFVLNFFRDHKITRKMQTIMWFSGLRGAIAFALSLFLNFGNDKHEVIKTTTLIIVLFSTLILGGCTMPLMKLVGDVNDDTPRTRRRNAKRSAISGRIERGKKRKDLNLVKTHDWKAIDSEAFSEMTESEDAANPGEVGFIYMNKKSGLIKLDEVYLKPFFTKRFTSEEIRTGRIKMKQLTNQWYSNIRGPNDEDSSAEDDITLLANDRQPQDLPSNGSTHNFLSISTSSGRQNASKVSHHALGSKTVSGAKDDVGPN